MLGFVRVIPRHRNWVRVRSRSIKCRLGYGKTSHLDLFRASATSIGFGLGKDIRFVFGKYIAFGLRKDIGWEVELVQDKGFGIRLGQDIRFG